jgi:hypothetical protein
MTFSLENTVALLSRTPASLDALLRGLPDEWTLRNEGGKSWAVFEVVGHLIHCDLGNWVTRAKRILDFGESKPFKPLDREGQRRTIEGKRMEQLLDEFALARAESLAELSALHLQPADFERRGTHPAFGPVTLSQLIATWAAHDLTHLHQISRVLAVQYREAVGSWARFLGVMHCEGHSEQA